MCKEEERVFKTFHCSQDIATQCDRLIDVSGHTDVARRRAYAGNQRMKILYIALISTQHGRTRYPILLTACHQAFSVRASGVHGSTAWRMRLRWSYSKFNKPLRISDRFAETIIERSFQFVSKKNATLLSTRSGVPMKWAGLVCPSTTSDLCQHR